MREVSQKYKEIMGGLVQPTTKVKIDVDMYNVEASDTARVSPSSAQYWGNITGINVDDVKRRYVSFEPDFYRLDKALLIEPENEAEYMEQGWVTQQMSGENGQFSTPILLQIDFPSVQHGFYGFTFHFDSDDGSYPESVLFEAYNGGHFIVDEEISVTGPNVLLRPEFVDGFDLLFLHFNGMNKPFRRLRVGKIGFGATKHLEREN